MPKPADSPAALSKRDIAHFNSRLLTNEKPCSHDYKRV